MKVGQLTHTYSEVNTALQKAVQAMNYGPSEWTLDGIVDGSEPNGEIVVASSVPGPGGWHASFFAAYKGITSIVCEGSASFDDGAFAAMPNLKSVYIKNGRFGRNTFDSCKKLERAIYDRTCASGTGSWMFSNSGLTFLDYGISSGFGAEALSNTPVKTIILRKTDKVVTCSFSSFPTFANSSIAEGGTGCDIYVPEALIDSYKTDTNWAAWDAYGNITWKAIEGSEYE